MKVFTHEMNYTAVPLAVAVSTIATATTSTYTNL